MFLLGVVWLFFLLDLLVLDCVFKGKWVLVSDLWVFIFLFYMNGFFFGFFNGFFMEFFKGFFSGIFNGFFIGFWLCMWMMLFNCFSGSMVYFLDEIFDICFLIFSLFCEVLIMVLYLLFDCFSMDVGSFLLFNLEFFMMLFIFFWL